MLVPNRNGTKTASFMFATIQIHFIHIVVLNVEMKSKSDGHGVILVVHKAIKIVNTKMDVVP